MFSGPGGKFLLRRTLFHRFHNIMVRQVMKTTLVIILRRNCASLPISFKICGHTSQKWTFTLKSKKPTGQSSQWISKARARNYRIGTDRNWKHWLQFQISLWPSDRDTTPGIRHQNKIFKRECIIWHRSMSTRVESPRFCLRIALNQVNSDSCLTRVPL